MVQRRAARWTLKRYSNINITPIWAGEHWSRGEVTRGLHSFSRSTTDLYQLTPESTSDIQLEDPSTHTATASFLYLLVPPLTIFHSTL